MRIPQLSLKRIIRITFLKLQILDIWPGMIRYKFLRMAGIKVGRGCHIGGGNLFDSIRPDLISIGHNTTVSTRCIVLSHFVHQMGDHREWSYGNVIIGNNVFLGANVIICQPVTIGDNSAIAVGAVVKKDILAGEIWGWGTGKIHKY